MYNINGLKRKGRILTAAVLSALVLSSCRLQMVSEPSGSDPTASSRASAFATALTTGMSLNESLSNENSRTSDPVSSGISASSGISVSSGAPVSSSPPAPSSGTPTDSPDLPSESTKSPESTESPDPPFDPMAFYNYQYDFHADLSEYEMYMNPEGNEYLMLVNSQYMLSEKDAPGDMIGVINTRNDGRDQAKLRLYAAKALEALFIEAEKDEMLYKNKVWQSNGIYYDYYVLSVTTAYRDYKWQYELYESAVKKKMDAGLSREEAEKAVTTTAKPGASEHQTGLCVDMHNFKSASSTNGMREEFAANEAGQWLQENCHKFGFILRYPEDKTEQTGIGYESWHYRYVGRFHATRMKELGMCLEEYAAYLESYGYTVNQWD